MNHFQEILGLEWCSWLAQVVETIVVLVLFSITIRQLKLQRRATHEQTVATLNQTIATIITWVQAEEIRLSRGLLYRLEDELEISKLPVKEWDEQWKQAADRVSQCFNSAAIIAQQEPRVHEIWIRPTSRAILKSWAIVQPRILERRHDDPELWKEFEWLAGIAKSYVVKNEQTS